MTSFDVKKLTEQLDAAQSILEEIRLASGCEAFGPRRQPSSDRQETALEAALRAYDNRQARTEFIGDHSIFGEPAWDMLLDLFIRQAQQEQISIKSACRQSQGPASTAMRWLNVLEHNGLIAVKQDPGDNSRHLVHLTAAGYEGMLRYLESIAVKSG